MTDPIWPSDLPQVPLADGYSVTPGDNTITFETEVGVSQTRRRATNKPQVITANYLMTATELTAWNEFYYDELSNGSLWFQWPNPILLENKRARIQGVPQILPIAGGMRWRVNLQLQVENDNPAI